MKNLLLLFVLLPLLAMSQAPVKTEAASNRYKFYNAATTGDTVFTSATSVASGSSIENYGVRGYLVGALVGTPVSNDTLIIKGGSGVVSQVVLDSTTTITGGNTKYTMPFFIPIGVKLDTMLIYIQKKTSSVTLIFRTGY
jgi:hypothetical protein